MKNELLETYIKDNNLQNFKKEYLSDFSIQLSDGNSNMVLTQFFNYVTIEINGEFFHIFEKTKGIDKIDHWFIVK